MTKHEADVIGGLNMTDQISNEAYKQIMIAAQDENEVGEVLDKIRAEIMEMPTISFNKIDVYKADVFAIINKYRKEQKC
jgi:hypothetical protein